MTWHFSYEVREWIEARNRQAKFELLDVPGVPSPEVETTLGGEDDLP